MKMFKARLLDDKGFLSIGCAYVFANDEEEAKEVLEKRILCGFVVAEIKTPTSAEIYAIHGGEK